MYGFLKKSLPDWFTSFCYIYITTSSTVCLQAAAIFLTSTPPSLYIYMCVWLYFLAYMCKTFIHKVSFTIRFCARQTGLWTLHLHLHTGYTECFLYKIGKASKSTIMNPFYFSKSVFHELINMVYGFKMANQIICLQLLTLLAIYGKL